MADLHKLRDWVLQAYDLHAEWRQASFEDYAFRDGAQWTEADVLRLKEKGITAITVNRIFSQINLVQGLYVSQQRDVVAKGRSHDDTELANCMSEAIRLVMDQYNGVAIQQKAFLDQIITGIGYVGVDYNADPRKETVEPYYIPWHDVWWDPSSVPEFDPVSCRYVFTASWKRLEDLIYLFPEHAKELQQYTAGHDYRYQGLETVLGQFNDPTDVINETRVNSRSYWQAPMNQVRPVEIWYPEYKAGIFIQEPSGHIIDTEVSPIPAERMAYLQSQGASIITATVPRMRHVIFLDDLELLDEATPYSHDEYPIVPYPCYLDRFGRPFGIPRSLKEQQMEVNSRRSMALSLINGRRVTIEENAAVDNLKAYKEANRTDGYVEVRTGKLQAIKIEDLAPLATPQVSLMEISEREIQDIAGTNQEIMSSETPQISKLVLEERQKFSLVKLTGIFENARLAQKRLGELLLAAIQDTWVAERILRVTDQLTGIERFVEINKRVNAGVVNDICATRFDITIASKAISDTVREKNLELVFAAINASPKEVVPSLLALAFELSDLPNKGVLLDLIRMALNVPEMNLMLSPKERQLLLMQKQQKQEIEATKAQQIADMLAQLEVAEKQVNIAKLKADVEATQINAASSLDMLETAKLERGRQYGLSMFGSRLNDAETGT